MNMSINENVAVNRVSICGVERQCRAIAAPWDEFQRRPRSTSVVAGHSQCTRPAQRNDQLFIDS